jgi:hypothetical protein
MWIQMDNILPVLKLSAKFPAMKLFITSSLLLFGLATTAVDVPCIGQSTISTLEDLTTCLEGYAVQQRHYTRATYDLAQPTSTERAAWAQAVQAVLDVDSNCNAALLPHALDGIYTISLYTERSTTNQYCVLSEKTAGPAGYTRGWGFVIVPATRRAVSRFVHISAPHPIYDANTPRQAAALFKRAGAKSLLVDGRDRRAFLEQTDCVIPSAGNGPYYETDPAHNNVRFAMIFVSLC